MYDDDDTNVEDDDTQASGFFALYVVHAGWIRNIVMFKEDGFAFLYSVKFRA